MFLILSHGKLQKCYFLVNTEDLVGRGHSVLLCIPLLIAYALILLFKHIKLTMEPAYENI